MHLVFLYGAPATGKYTVGRELAALTGYELFHNHVVVDAVLQRHAFGTPEFVAERDAGWRAHLSRAVERRPPGLISTFNPENTVPTTFVDWLFNELAANDGVALHSVKLHASDAEIADRLNTAQRRQFHKLTDVRLYAQLRADGAFDSPRIPRTDLRLDTGRMTAPEAARRIVDHFHLLET